MEKEILLFGGLLLDHYFSVDRWPQRGQDGYVVGQARFVGGCAANMAVTIHNLGGHPHVVSCVGSDRSGETIQRYWREHSLSRRFILETEGETGSCLVFSEPNGERTFLTRKGVELSFPADLAEAVLLCEPAWAGVTGYYLLGEEGPQILSCLERLHRRGTRILFDPSPLAGDIAPALRKRILAISDVLTPSEKELDALGGHEGGGAAGPGWQNGCLEAGGTGRCGTGTKGEIFLRGRTLSFGGYHWGGRQLFRCAAVRPGTGWYPPRGHCAGGPVCGQDSGASRPPWILEEERRFLSLKISEKSPKGWPKWSVIP